MEMVGAVMRVAPLFLSGYHRPMGRQQTNGLPHHGAGRFHTSTLRSLAHGLPGVVRPSATTFSSNFVSRATVSFCVAARFFVSPRSAARSYGCTADEPSPGCGFF